MRRRCCAAFAVAVALVVPATAGADAVTQWNRIAMATLVAIPPPASGAPSALQINLGMTQGAVYDAVNATEPKHYRPYLLKRRFAATASSDAAVATAAYRVLSSILAGVPGTIGFPNRGALQAGLDAQYAAALAPLPHTPFTDQGIAAGEAAAAAMIAARVGDGRFGPSQWSGVLGVGLWQPLLNPDKTPMLDPTPWVGGVRPFLIESSSQFRTPGPNALTSAQYATDFNEVKELGSATSATRTADQTHIALFWQSAGGPAVLWSNVADTLAEQRGLSSVDTARLLAMLNLAGADAAINCWNDKYHFDFWRPWNAIPQADLDGNLATDPDPTWAPLLTAPYPEHPSGHMCLDGAELAVLEHVFGTGTVHFGVTSSRFPNDPRFFDSFAQPLAEITLARVWAGLHFRTADLQGLALGQHVTQYMLEHYFQRVGNGG
jgi:hypothetical protein